MISLLGRAASDSVAYKKRISQVSLIKAISINTKYCSLVSVRFDLYINFNIKASSEHEKKVGFCYGIDHSFSIPFFLG